MTCKTHIVLLILLSVLIGGGCGREDIPSGDGRISFTFYTGEPITRAVGDGNAADGGGIAVVDEKPDIIIALANSSGNIVAWYPNENGDSYQSECSSSSATEATISFDSPAQGTYSVYAVANTHRLNTSDSNPKLSAAIKSQTTVAGLEALVLQRSAQLSFNANNPMPLSAKGSVTANSRGAGQVNLELKRVVARVGLSFDNKTGGDLTLYNCSITLHTMNPFKGYLFAQNTDYVSNWDADLVLWSEQNIEITGASYDINPKLVFPSVAPTQQEGGKRYLCDISFRIVKAGEEYDANNSDTYTSYNNNDLPVQDLSTYESILALSRNQDLTILTEINKRDQDDDISFNFFVTTWTNKTEEVTFN